MEKYNYGPIKNTASEMVYKFGRDFTLRQTTTSGPSYNPTITNTDSTIIGVMTDYTSAQIDGTLIQANDKQILTYETVTNKDKIIDGGVVYSVVNVKEIKPANDTILYKVQVRK